MIGLPPPNPYQIICFQLQITLQTLLQLNVIDNCHFQIILNFVFSFDPLRYLIANFYFLVLLFLV